MPPSLRHPVGITNDAHKTDSERVVHLDEQSHALAAVSGFQKLFKVRPWIVFNLTVSGCEQIYAALWSDTFRAGRWLL